MFNIDQGTWRYSEYGVITTSRPGIIEGSKTICDVNKNHENWEEHAKAILALPKLLKLAKLTDEYHSLYTKGEDYKANQVLLVIEELKKEISNITL